MQSILAEPCYGFMAQTDPYPRTEVCATKREIYNLYHYLNHYNLFGGGYLGGCERGLSALAALPAS